MSESAGSRLVILPCYFAFAHRYKRLRERFKQLIRQRLAQIIVMARRAAPQNAVPGLFAAPPPRRAIHDPSESAFSRFVREEIWAPEKLPGNIGIVTGTVVFVAGVFAARTWGDILVPA